VNGLRLDQIPPRLFSETMRDLDSWSASRIGVVWDPEATASTVEMRAALVGRPASCSERPTWRSRSTTRDSGLIGQVLGASGDAGVMVMPGSAIPSWRCIRSIAGGPSFHLQTMIPAPRRFSAKFCSSRG